MGLASGGRRLALALLVACAALPAAASAASEPVDYVDPMVGTAPVGFVFPGPTVPFGMVQNSPDTTGEFAYSGYLYTDPVIRGFSLVHLSGPGVRKAGDIPFMPTLAPPTDDPNQYASTFSHASEQASAGYYKVHLDAAATDVELTASTHAAMQRYTFAPSPKANVIVDVARSVEGVHDGSFSVSGPNEISGWSRGRYPVYFVAQFSRAFADSGKAGKAGFVSFDTTTDRTVTMRVGISFVDLAGARRNLGAEAPNYDFDAMRARARAAWNRELSRVRVSGGAETDLKSFYTALYHAQLHPNTFTDVDGRYLGFDGKSHVASGRTQYANFSLWDLYKSQNQLLALIQPDRYRDMLLSLLADYREGGKLPRWGEQNTDPAHMTGDPAIPMIAEGACRGVLDRGSLSSLYDAAVALVGRREPEMKSLGYLPVEKFGGGAGTTLEYGVADFALAQMAARLGRSAEAARWLSDSLRYRKLLDPSTRWIRPRHADGSWLSPFDPTDETGFQEGNSWQYSWLAPHDARGLFDRMGGNAAVIDRLDEFFRLPPEVQNRATAFGTVYRTDQYAPGNEHDLQAPYMYAFAGQPWKTMNELREQQSLFRPTPDGLPGNDDLGGLSAWHVWSALGLGPATPGAPFYVLGSPQFEHAVFDVPGHRRFTVDAPGASLLGRYVRSATLAGRPLHGTWLWDRALRDGASLRLEMGARPNESFGAASPPPSGGDSGLGGFGCSAR